MMIEKVFNEPVEEQASIYNFTLVDNRIFYFSIKRTMDIILALAGLLIGIPVMLVLAIAIKLESEGPVIFRQERLGRKGKPFIIYKLRSMYNDAESIGPKWADKSDERVTKVGHLIRRTRIDEIPQLLNILKGDMSIVGPRPERPFFTYEFRRDIPGFINRLTVKPGLTGLAQVNGGYNITPREKFVLDMKYIEKMSIAMDIKIILRTIIIVLTGDGAR